MSGFIQGDSRTQATLLPECLDDYIHEDNPVRVVDVFVDRLELGKLGLKICPQIPVDLATILPRC